MVAAPTQLEQAGVTNVAVPAWLAAIVGAWFISPELGAASLIGYAGQWALKAPKQIRDWAAPLIVVVVCLGVWTVGLGHMPAAFPPPREWWAAFATWATAALGIGSVSGHTGGAPRTNSI